MEVPKLYIKLIKTTPTRNIISSPEFKISQLGNGESAEGMFPPAVSPLDMANISDDDDDDDSFSI